MATEKIYRNIGNPDSSPEPIGNILARSFFDEQANVNRVETGLFALSQSAVTLHNRILALGARPDQEALYSRLAPAFRKGEPLCESPIEKVMLGALMAVDFERGQAIFPQVFDCRLDSVMPDVAVVICPQFPFIRFRVDFMVLIRHGDHVGQFVCEADGQAFHDASYDRARDTLMYSAGVAGIFRVGGKKLMGSPNSALLPLEKMIADWRKGLG